MKKVALLLIFFILITGIKVFAVEVGGKKQYVTMPAFTNVTRINENTVFMKTCWSSDGSTEIEFEELSKHISKANPKIYAITFNCKNSSTEFKGTIAELMGWKPVFASGNSGVVIIFSYPKKVGDENLPKIGIHISPAM